MSVEVAFAARATTRAYRCEGACTLQYVARSSLHLLLGADVTVVSTLALAAVGGLGWQSSVALAANVLVTLVGASKGSKRWLNLDAANTATAETQHQMEGGLLLDVVVGQGAAVLKLLAGEDQSLLVGGNALLVLDLGPKRRRKRTEG